MRVIVCTGSKKKQADDDTNNTLQTREHKVTYIFSMLTTTTHTLDKCRHNIICAVHTLERFFKNVNLKLYSIHILATFMKSERKLNVDKKQKQKFNVCHKKV